MSNNAGGPRWSEGEPNPDIPLAASVDDLDAFVSDLGTVDFTPGASVVLTTLQFQSAYSFDLINASASHGLTLPAIRKQSRFNNKSGSDITLIVGTQNLAIKNSTAQTVYTDGTPNGLALAATATPQVVPAGGAAGTVLTKNSSADFDILWAAPAGGGGGGGGGGTYTPWDFSPSTAAHFNNAFDDGTHVAVADDTDVGVIASTLLNATTNVIRGAYHQSTPSGAWSLTWKMKHTIHPANYNGVGVGFCGGSSSDVCVFSHQYSAGNGGSIACSIDRFHQPTGYRDTPWQGNNYSCDWFRVSSDASGNLSFYTSGDGKLWTLQHTDTMSSLFGVSLGSTLYFGPTMFINNSDSVTAGASFGYWLESGLP